MYALASGESRLLAARLPDTPETVIATSQLRHGRARAWVDNWPQWQTAVVEDTGQPGEPFLFGPPIAGAIALFLTYPQWICLNVAPAVAVATTALFAAAQMTVRQYGDLYYCLETAVGPVADTAARRLTLSDLPLLSAAPVTMVGADPVNLLRHKIAAGVVVDGKLVALAQNYALSPRYGDVGVATLPAYRRRGYATQAATLVGQWLQANGRIPVWSCGADNLASRRTAARLGFRQHSKRVYLIVTGRPAGC